MKNSTLLAVAAATLLPAVAASTRLVARQDDDSEYLDKVCRPATAADDDVVPPCVQIAVIEAQCLPNGTEPLHYAAHAQCMCKGSYFQDWQGCQDCLHVHGFLSERDNAYWSRVASAASEALCTGTPTAAFQSLFASAEENTGIPFATTGSTQTSDQYPSKTAVSLYYTPSTQQGPGRIEGEATLATADKTSTPEPTPTGSGDDDDDEDDDEPATTTSSDGPASTNNEEEQTTTSSDNAAAPTNGAALVLAMAGAAMLAAI